MLAQSGWLELIGRITAQNQSGGGAQGYHIQIADGGSWTLFAQDATMNNTSLATGTVSFPLNSWHTLALDFKGTAITALFDNTPLATITDGTYSTGNAGLGAKQWINAQFDNFAVTGQSTSSDAGTAVVDAGSGGSTPVCAAHPPPADANSLSVITAFANVTADAGAGASTWFGSWSTDASVFGGGSYSYPGMGPGTDSLANPAAGNYCTTLASQNTFVATATPGTGLVISGQVSTFSGIGFYLYHCVDASTFHGIQFTISGDVGNELVSNMGSPNQLTFSVGMLPDDKVGNGLGTCTLPGCASPSYSFTVPAQPTTFRVTWEMLTGGAPIYVLDPRAISGISWSFPWPCAASVTPYTTHIILSDVAFY